MVHDQPSFICHYTKDITPLIPESHIHHRLKIQCVQGLPPPSSISIPQPSDGCEYIFRETFLNREMYLDLPLIFREFTRLEHSNLSRYAAEAAEFPPLPSFSPAQTVFQKLFDLMYAALRLKSSAALNLFKKLYKIYYPQEYHQLKRFHSISYRDILALANAPEDDNFVPATSRILTACGWFSITQESDCAAIHFALNHYFERQKADFEKNNCPEPSAQHQQTILNMTEKFAEELTSVPELQTYHFLSDIAETFLCISGDLIGADIDAADNLTDLQQQFSYTLSVLKTKYPKRSFSLEEIQTATVIFTCAEYAVLQAKRLSKTLEQILFLDAAADSSGCRFRPDRLAPTPPKPEKPSPSTRPTDSDNLNNKLQLEINSLRIRLDEQERENRHLHALYSESRDSLSKAREFLKEYENNRQELIALRDYVYHLTENDTILPSCDLGTMTSAIASKKIIIIGGHSNWIYKLRNRFPSWNFLSPKTSGSVDSRLLKHADYVYFFTSIIKHSTYMRFIRIVREQNIPFGYIHTIHIPSNIQQIYNDISARI